MGARSIVIFGARGFIGKALVTDLSGDAAFEVIPFTSADADLTDETQANALVPRIPRGVVLVMTAAISPDQGTPDRAGMAANVRMANSLAGLIESTAPSQVIFLSSIDVYGREDLILPLSESSEIRPSNYYGISKYASEMILERACNEAGANLAILRLPGVYGPGDTHSRRSVRMFFRAALDDAPITIYGDGNQRRDLLYVGDVPLIIRAFRGEPSAGVFNAVTGTSRTLNEMVELIRRIVGAKMPVQYQPAPQIDIDFKPSRLRERFPELVFTPLEEGFRRSFNALIAARG